MELTSKQLAEAFGVKPGTVTRWKVKGKLKAHKPGGANRLGMRAKIRDIRAYIDTLPEEDREYTRARFESWLQRHEEEVRAAQPDYDTSTLDLVKVSA